MAGPAATTKGVPVRGLATIALLKARFDENVDHLDMFMPLVLDTVAAFEHSRFSTEQVGDALRQRHGISIPPMTVKTLLQRAVKRRSLQREHGVFLRPTTFQYESEVPKKKNDLLVLYFRLAESFRQFASAQGVTIATNEDALAKILEFLEANQVDLLLEVPVDPNKHISTRDIHLVAQFFQSTIATDRELASAAKGIMEGLVLSNAAFLRDIADTRRQFRDLDIYLDSHIVRRALGYEGPLQERVTREILEILTRANARCRVFDKTVDEIRGILLMFQRKLATPEGKRSLHLTDMARHFLTLRPSDVAERNALLEADIGRIGLQIVATPRHVPAFTLDEKRLQEGLADEKTGDDASPRVLHDVDCVAAVLTLRKGRSYDRIDDVRALFAMVEGRTLDSVRQWYAGQRGAGIGPAVHIRALANLAWLRCPMLLGDLKLHELAALCASALQPSRTTWERFLKHLDELKSKGHLTSDEAVAIVASQLTEKLLADADAGPDEPDATTLDEIVDRVKESYQAEARQTIEAHEAHTRAQLEAAAAAARSEFEALGENAMDARRLADQAERKVRDVRARISLRARRQARLVSHGVFGLVACSLLGGAGHVFFSHELHRTLAGVLAATALGAFLVFELFGVLKHASELRERFRGFLMDAFYRRLTRAVGLPDEPPDWRVTAMPVSALQQNDSSGGEESYRKR